MLKRLRNVHASFIQEARLFSFLSPHHWGFARLGEDNLEWRMPRFYSSFTNWADKIFKSMLSFSKVMASCKVQTVWGSAKPVPKKSGHVTSTLQVPNEEPTQVPLGLAAILPSLAVPHMLVFYSIFWRWETARTWLTSSKRMLTASTHAEECCTGSQWDQDLQFHTTFLTSHRTSPLTFEPLTKPVVFILLLPQLAL